MLRSVARAFSAVFAPELFLFGCGLLAVGYEWSRQSERTVAGLAARVGALGGGWIVALAAYVGLPRLLGPALSGTNVVGSVALGVDMLVVWGVWRAREWGRLVPRYAAAVIAVTVPHLLITPVWNLSSHVLYAALPAGFLLGVDRRFAPLAAVPALMAFARPLAGAHTWAQSFAGLALAAAVLVAVRGRPRAGERPGG